MKQGIGIGDLVFVRNTGLLPWLIRWWTRRGAPGGYQGFNHVAMCVGENEWLSAEPRGVVRRSLGEILNGAEEHVILHFTGPARVGFAAAQIATGYLNSGYDFLGVAGFVLSRVIGLRVDFRGRWFCSEICHSAWQETLCENGLLRSFRDSADTTPNDLMAWAKAQGYFQEIKGNSQIAPSGMPRP